MGLHSTTCLCIIDRWKQLSVWLGEKRRKIIFIRNPNKELKGLIWCRELSYLSVMTRYLLSTWSTSILTLEKSKQWHETYKLWKTIFWKPYEKMMSNMLSYYIVMSVKISTKKRCSVCLYPKMFVWGSYRTCLHKVHHGCRIRGRYLGSVTVLVGVHISHPFSFLCCVRLFSLSSSYVLWAQWWCQCI